MTGIPEGTVRYLRRELGLTKKRNWISEETRQQILALRAEGLTYKQIAEAVEQRPATVESVVKRAASMNGCTRKSFAQKMSKGIPVAELFERTKANLMLTVKWSKANVQTIYQ
ncbi:hypothetical protein [Endozoicomonas sp. GU-1]|uniref:hypothetical protein n=1 Tax=Endozoicomonas sp. GU-1 TaxID=3009078 RepID=UPI0022B3076A|nr:hypothetical protein [Endozoicomonas sp. GU-1]WBA79578.1 hypothetical protein O2T12_14435 [Endozoicomonas sp. GU-1]